MQTQIDPTAFVSLWNEGHSFTEIGQKFGVTRGTVAGHLDRMKRKGVEMRTGHAKGRKANGDRIEGDK